MDSGIKHQITLEEHQCYNFKFGDNTNVMDMKEDASNRFTKLFGRKVHADNLEFCFCKFGEIYE